MPPTREQFNTRVKELQEQVSRARAVDLSLLHSALVKAEAMTGHPAWDGFLQQCQGRLDDAVKERDGWGERMRDAFQESDMRMAQVNWHIANSRINTLNEIMELPRRVIETARKELTQG